MFFTYMTSPRTPSRFPFFDNKENVRPVFQMPRRRFPSNKMPNRPMRTIKRKKTSFKVRRDSPPKRKPPAFGRMASLSDFYSVNRP